MSENSKPKQVNRVLAHLLAHGSITQQEAMVDLGVMRLASRVSELKKAGYPTSAGRAKRRCCWMLTEKTTPDVWRAKHHESTMQGLPRQAGGLPREL